jgi:hypothetical protein
VSIDEAIVEKYWVESPNAFNKRIKEIISFHTGEVEVLELCKNSLGKPVPEIRLGKGAKHVYLLGRMHGHEAVGTCGLTALIEGLLEGKTPGSEHSFKEARRILESFKLHIFPMYNPDAAARSSKQIKDSYLPSRFSYTQKDFRCYMEIRNEPALTLKRERPAYFLPNEMEAWLKKGKSLGTLYTEDGVELWMDWNYEKAPQTRAIKKAMNMSKPSLFVDIHSWEQPTMIWMPALLNDETLKLHRGIGNLFYDELEKYSIPFKPDREIRVEELGEEKAYMYAGGEAPKGMPPIQWVYDNFGAASFVYDIDSGYRWYDGATKTEDVKIPTVSKSQIVLSVWYGITAMLQGLLKEKDR